MSLGRHPLAAPTLSRALGPSPTPQPGPGQSPKVDIVWPTRFYGVKTLNSDKIAQEFKNVADEVLAHLGSGENTSVTVPIEATDFRRFQREPCADRLGEGEDAEVRPVWLRGELITPRQSARRLRPRRLTRRL